jgi:hypothetical protein
MLRHVVALSVKRGGGVRNASIGSAVLQSAQRPFCAAAATSGQKRALNKQQLTGESVKNVAASGGATGADANAEWAGGGGGSGNTIPILLGLAAVGGGAAYYMDMIPNDWPSVGSSNNDKPTPPTGKETPSVASAVAAATPKAKQEKPKEKEPTQVAVETLQKEEDESASNNVVAGEEAPIEEYTAALDADEPTGNNGSVSQSVQPEEAMTPPVKASLVNAAPTEQQKVSVTPPPPAASQHEPSVETALKELQKEMAAQSSVALQSAHQELAKLSSLDVSDLDAMSQQQLKVRLIQMAKEMQDRTKWEAVRLKEFLAMKEKETADE